MENNKILEIITRYADEAHGQQLRKYSEDRYIVHPIRVMKTCQRFTDDISIHAAALLHDVLEDTSTEQSQMVDFLKTVVSDSVAHNTVQLVIELTDVYTKNAYPHLKRFARKSLEIERLKLISPQAQTIKYADLLDNVQDIVSNDRSFAPQYVSESYRILQALDRGDKGLYAEVMALVKSCQRKLEIK